MVLTPNTGTVKKIDHDSQWRYPGTGSKWE